MNKKLAQRSKLCYHNFGATAPILGRGQAFIFCFPVEDPQPRRFYHSLSADAREKNVNKHTF